MASDGDWEVFLITQGNKNCHTEQPNLTHPGAC